MNIIPSDFPTLRSDHIGVMAVSRVSWLIMVQRGSENERRITAYLEACAREANIKPPPKSAIVPSAIPFPRLEATSAAAMAIHDCAYFILVKAGKEGANAPNETEFEVLKFVNQYGRKAQREKAQAAQPK